MRKISVLSSSKLSAVTKEHSNCMLSLFPFYVQAQGAGGPAKSIGKTKRHVHLHLCIDLSCTGPGLSTHIISCMALKTMHYDEVRRKLERPEGKRAGGESLPPWCNVQCAPDKSLPTITEEMQIIVKTITEETVTLYVKDTDTIDSVKDNLSRHCDLEPKDMLLFLIDNSRPFATHPVYPRDGKYLYGDLTLSGCKIAHMSTLVLRYGECLKSEYGPLFRRVG